MRKPLGLSRIRFNKPTAWLVPSVIQLISDVFCPTLPIMTTLQRCQKPCCWRQFFHNRGKAGDVWEEHPGRRHNECSQLWLSSNPYVQQKRPPAWNPGTMYRNQGEGGCYFSSQNPSQLILCRVTSKQRALVFHSIQLRRYHDSTTWKIVLVW